MKLRRTETKPEIWTVQENCQNSTGTDQEHSRRHGPRRKGQGIRRHIRRKFYHHNGFTQNFLSDHDRFKDEIYAHLYSHCTQDNQRKRKSYSTQEWKDFSWTRIMQKNMMLLFRNSRT